MEFSYLAFAVLLLVAVKSSSAYNSTLGWQTLSKNAPLIIANGGSSGIYPDQIDPAYIDALNSSSLPLAILCDLQLTMDNLGICRTGWNLSETANLTSLLTNTSTMSTYVIQGVSETAYFALDFNQADLLYYVTAIQHDVTRSPYFDGAYPILAPEYVAGNVQAGGAFYFWLNIEYPSFYQQHPGKNSLASYLTSFLKSNTVAYLSATEVGILKLLQSTAAKNSTKLVFKVLGSNVVEESTNTTYGSLLSNLTDIATFANGVMVPKEFVYPENDVYKSSSYGYYTDAPTDFVQSAHKAGLEVYVYKFANDDFPSSYNYSFDPVREYLSYIGDTFNVDGYLTDFPTTAAEAINCYPDGYVSSSLNSGDITKSVQKPTIISHNGASGDYPGCTLPAYMAAISDGADYIDCTVQITRDGVAICREDPDLIKSTNVFSNQILYTQYLSTYSALQSAQGVFTFDMPWTDIQTLRAKIYSPWANYDVNRDPQYDGKYNIITLDDFLSFAKNNSGIGVYVNLQNAYYLRTEHNLDLVDAVVTSLAKANLTNADDKVLVASEDSSALAAIHDLVALVKLVYNAKYTTAVSVTLPVLQEIKKYTSIVALDRHLVDPIDSSTTFLYSETSVVRNAHSLNMTVLYFFLSNEFNGYAADYRSDPTLQINSLIQLYNIDGFITDHPATLYNFLHKNYCYQPLGGKTVDYSAGIYAIYPVVPGVLPNITDPIAPSPALSVGEPSISYVVPEASPSPGSGISPAPSLNAASRLSISLYCSIMLILITTFLLK